MTRIRYARTADGVDIAFATTGTGPPVLFARPLLRAAIDEEIDHSLDPGIPRLARAHTVVIWDVRGSGLSRSVSPSYTLESSLLDLAAVADALRLHTFDLIAQLTPCHTAVAFAARNPSRVRRLVLRNPSDKGMSPRTSTLADLPDIAGTHFREYIQLAVLRMAGWGRGAVASAWVDRLLGQFDSHSWDRLMTEMESVDATAEIGQVVAPSLVFIDATAPDRHMSFPEERRQFIRSVAARLSEAELSILRASDPPDQWAIITEEFLSSATRGAVGDPAGMAVILFADIAESTALTERLGDSAFRERARDLDDALREIITDASGTPVEGKLLGDGVLATFPSAAQAIEGARRCLSLSAASELGLHIGLHAGDVIREENNVFGGAVNIAARICALSEPGEILVSDVVRGMARSSAGVAFEDRGEHTLKGIAEPQRVFAVRIH